MKNNTGSVKPELDPPAILATSAILDTENRNNRKNRNGSVIENNTALPHEHHQTLLDYLAAIGETDPAVIDELLAECSINPDILVAQLNQAQDCLMAQSGNTTGMVQCQGCQHLNGDTCQHHAFRVVINKWRRCPDRKTGITTCGQCSNFQSYYDHGQGAGGCAANVQPMGACWWFDTRHACESFIPVK